MGENFGNSVNFILEALNQQIDFKDFEKSFKLFHKVALFKQVAERVWHGSVVGSIVDGNLDLLNMIGIGEQISNSVDLGTSTQKAAQLWADLRKIANAQNDANFASLLQEKIDTGLVDKDVDRLAEAYDTTIDVIEEDVKRFKQIGYTKEYLGVTNQYRNILYLNHEALLTNISYDFGVIEQAFEEEVTIRSRMAGNSSGVSVNLYREFWLAFFRSAIAVPFDDFTYQCALFAQLNHGRLDLFFNKHLVKFLNQKAYELNFTVDIRKDGQFVKQVINMITSKDAKARPEETSQPRNTVPTKGGKAFYIPHKTFNLRDVREAMAEVKRGDGPDLSIRILQESFSFDQSLQDLKLQGQVIKGKSGQAFWTFGNSHENDFFLPKTGVMFGTHFAIFYRDGKYLIRDFSTASENLSMLIKLPKDQKFRVSEGSLLSFAASTDYEIQTYSNNRLKMNFFRHCKKPTNVYDPPSQVTLEIPEQGLKLGRVSKDNQIVIGNKFLSGNHCTIFTDGIVDTSGNGTFVYVKSYQEVVKHHQSQTIEVQKSTQFQFSDILLALE